MVYYICPGYTEQPIYPQLPGHHQQPASPQQRGKLTGLPSNANYNLLTVCPHCQTILTYPLMRAVCSSTDIVTPPFLQTVWDSTNICISVHRYNYANIFNPAHNHNNANIIIRLHIV